LIDSIAIQRALSKRTLFTLALFLTLLVARLACSTDYYVDGDTGTDEATGSNEHPWRTITHALGQAENGDTVYVRYAETEYHDSLVVPAGVNLIGIPQETRRPIIRSKDANSHTISLINYTGRIQGLAVTGTGDKNGINCSAENGGTNSAEIIDCEIFGNSMGIHNVTTVDDDNHDDNCSPYIHRNLIHSNSTRGIGNMLRSSATIDGNYIFENGSGSQDQGGIGNRDDSTALIVNNVICENDRFGIAVRDRSAPKIVNNTIVFHDATQGAGITVLQNEGILFVVIINNVIASNQRGLVSEGDKECTGNDYNNVWNNNTLWSYRGFSMGSNDISEDPLFVDPEKKNFHLQWGSPCIDSGSLEETPNLDIDGDPRPQFETYDMGADEYFVRGLSQAILILEVVSDSGSAQTILHRLDLNNDGRIGIEDAAMVLQEVSQHR
jgi:hypothetical protein